MDLVVGRFTIQAKTFKHIFDAGISHPPNIIHLLLKPWIISNNYIPLHKAMDYKIFIGSFMNTGEIITELRKDKIGRKLI